MFSIRSSHLKLALSWMAVCAIRFVPFRPIGAEPVLAALMPSSKRFGALAGFAFASLSIVVFDLFTSGIGAWTYVTALAYGTLGLAASRYFAHRPATRTNFLAFGLAGTLAYDALTGLTVGPLVYHQPFMTALVGQIPFTLEHLLATSALAILVSPWLYRWYLSESVSLVSAPVRSRT